jgi:hypothetical protein
MERLTWTNQILPPHPLLSRLQKLMVEMFQPKCGGEGRMIVEVLTTNNKNVDVGTANANGSEPAARKNYILEWIQLARLIPALIWISIFRLCF